MTANPPPQDELRGLLWSIEDGSISAGGIGRIDELVRGDPELLRQYVEYTRLLSDLRFGLTAGRAQGVLGRMFDLDQGLGTSAGGLGTSAGGLGTSVPSEEGSGFSSQESESGTRDSELGDREPESPTPSSAPLVAPIVIDTSAPLHTPLFSLHSPLGGMLFSYGVATLLTGLAILGAWAYKVSLDSEIAGERPRPAPRLVQPELEFVARITGTADCHWTDPAAAPSRRDVTLGQAFSLSSGLVEIAYQSGAKVILQGPCVYEVESSTGGFLLLGRLTARVETKEEGGRGEAEGTDNQKSEIRNQKSPIPLPPSPFVVKTPTAVVTDLGTEFGVEVDKSGATRSHVFRGKIELRVADGGDGDVSVICLRENESAQVPRGVSRAVTVIRGARQADAQAFARQMPRRLPMKLSDTGVGLKEGDPDPHWQLVARSDDPHFKPRPAIVTTAPAPWWLPNDCGPSQWISAAGDSPTLPDGVTYTFRTTFELGGMMPGTAALRGRFIADNRVNAIRLNGRQVPVPEHADIGPFDRYHGFVAANGFVEGVNVLELDVYNGDAPPDSHPTTTSAMGLRVELDGAFTSDGRSSLPNKGAPSMND